MGVACLLRVKILPSGSFTVGSELLVQVQAYAANLESSDLVQMQARQYRPHLLTGGAAEKDWVKSLELTGAQSFMLEQARVRPLRTLILYGSLRNRSYSRLLAYEFAR